ncbi:hypothetical protein E4T38_05229 [Aureobasidium subglaciale]|nr:hypothetical protein E4T38_05229 [Aureobasidium subglaciale]KAI5220386.1 hypothetical protein E4T40_05993 [Aureobasidium subglaciale]KAI5222889.1 hypothetical protein E4T41_06419 [Aureobasidium subglaciale]KAI5260114.1 hypothetical protein E4T46_06301 [Aureobasidium subglaciale]
MEKHHAVAGFLRNSQVQLQHALKLCVNGKPYKPHTKDQPRGSIHTDEWTSQLDWGDIAEHHVSLSDSTDPFIKEFSRLFFGTHFKCTAAGDNDYPQEACGHCGKEKSDDGAPCHPCSQCGHRHYCSRKCELAHRPKHKLVCDDRFYKVVGNLVAKSQNQARDADSDMRSGSDVGQARLSGSSTPATKFPDGPLTCGNCDASRLSSSRSPCVRNVADSTTASRNVKRPIGHHTRNCVSPGL